MSVFDMGRREATGYVCVRRGTTGNDAKGVVPYDKHENQDKVIAAVVIVVILAFTLVYLLTGNINPVCRVTAVLMPVWLAAELRLLCTLL